MPSKEELQLQKRFVELSKIAAQRNVPQFSDFLDLHQQNIFLTLPKGSLYTSYVLFGGFESAERQMVGFLPDAFSLYGEDENDLWEMFPIKSLAITSRYKKFSQVLSHRDYLGSILGLGLERSKVGDILVGEESAIVFVHNNVALFLMQELCKVCHTAVDTVMTEDKRHIFHIPTQSISGSVSSIRLDSLLAVAFKTSRTKMTPLIAQGKVFVNGRLITTNAYVPNENDLISVRGMGKFCYKGWNHRSKKGRYLVYIEKYI